MKKDRLVVTLFCALVIAVPAVCSAASITMAVTGEKQGQLIGDNTQRGQEKTIVVLASSVELLSPHDEASGQATGRFQPGPVGITKNLDRSTPQLMQALIMNENLTSVVIRFYKRSHAGTLQNYFTITLADASLGALASTGNGASGAVEENLSLYWRRMEMKDELTGATSVADWALAP